MSQAAPPAVLCDLLSLSWRNGGDRRVPKQVLAWDGVPLAALLGGGVGHNISAVAGGVFSWLLEAVGEGIDAT